MPIKFIEVREITLINIFLLVTFVSLKPRRKKKAISYLLFQIYIESSCKLLHTFFFLNGVVPLSLKQKQDQAPLHFFPLFLSHEHLIMTCLFNEQLTHSLHFYELLLSTLFALSFTTVTFIDQTLDTTMKATYSDDL